jgi:uncharacterized membrane protein YkoI
MNSFRKTVAGAAIVGTAIVGGFIGSTFAGSANAQTADPAATAAADTATPAGPHVANGITETPLTGTDLDKAKAAALAAVPGATIDRAETDADGAKYEVHLTKADGSKATVKLDDAFAVTGIETGGGKGGHGGGKGGGGPHSANGKTETVLTGADADKATAAAKAAVPGATIDRVETDADGAAFEAHVTKADGSKATVLMDSAFKVTSVEAGK